jgi:hypothetical protein
MNDGGPAFPLSESDSFVHCGMTLRDYFAAKAMQAIITSTSGSLEGLTNPKIAASEAYQFSDWMIKARESK